MGRRLVRARVRRRGPAGRLARPATRGRSSSRARPGASSAAPARQTAARGARSRACASGSRRRDGIVLQQPAYSRYRVELGEISSYPPGYKENASIFCHTNPWITLGWCLLGEGDRALETYLAICPSTREERIDTYRSEPYVYAQTIAGPDAATPGEAKNSWLTGTAAWTFVSGAQGLLGIVPGLRRAADRPVHPARMGGRSASRAASAAPSTRSRCENPDGAGHGVRSLLVDGLEYDGNVVPPQAGPGPVRVEVVLGAPRHGERERLAAIGDTARHGVRGGCTS